MPITISVSTNELNTMIGIVEQYLKELRSNYEKLATDEVEKKARNRQLDGLIYGAINETIAKNNTHRIKNPNADLDDLFDMEFSEGNAGMYKDSINAFLDQTKGTEIEDIHPEHIARSKRLLEAFDNPVSDKK